MNSFYIDVLRAPSSEHGELIDVSNAVLAISGVLDKNWRWMRLSAEKGPSDKFDVRFYDVMASGSTQLSGGEVSAALRQCAGRGLRRCRVDAISNEPNDCETERPRIKVFGLDIFEFAPDSNQFRLNPLLRIHVENRRLFESIQLVEGIAFENESAWTDWLINIFMAVARALKPNTMHLYLDGEWALPVNSHLSYFGSASEVIRDLELLRAAWTTGLNFLYQPIHSLGQPEYCKHLQALSPYRSEKALEMLSMQFDTAFSWGESISEGDVRCALESSRLDVLAPGNDHESGFAVTNRPWFLEGWIDQFYLDVLGYEWWQDYGFDSA